MQKIGQKLPVFSIIYTFVFEYNILEFNILAWVYLFKLGKSFSRQNFEIFLFSPEIRIWYFMQIVSLGENLHDMSKTYFMRKVTKISPIFHLLNFVLFVFVEVLRPSQTIRVMLSTCLPNQWFFLPAHPESRTHIFCFGTHILNLSESQDSQSYSGKFCNGHNDFLVGLTLYSPNESLDA